MEKTNNVEEQSVTSTSDGSLASTAASTNGDVGTPASDHPSPSQLSLELEKTKASFMKEQRCLVAENAFDSEASRILFDAIDRFQSCGAGEYIDIPQLVIVGGQSTGKSSLLQSLTKIPFPVGTGTCTRFATRIVSRRTEPGAPTQVKVSIVSPDFRVSGLPATLVEDYQDYIHVRESLSPEEFSVVIDDAASHLGIIPGLSTHSKNFAVEVLKVEISGPNRSQFSILDIPGIFTNDFNVKEGEMDGVHDMVVEYMKQPGNIVICIADALSDLQNQAIFKLANSHVDKSRLIGVFTKCDLLRNPENIVSIATGKVEGVGRLLHHGWFVVRNRIENDKDDELDGDKFSLSGVEAGLFNQSPWTAIREDRRGSANLRKYLASLLCDKIKACFPGLLGRLERLLAESHASLARLGDPRQSIHQRRAYLAGVAQQYEQRARDALDRPWLLTDDAAMARILVRDGNDAFSQRMRLAGHAYEFEDHELGDDECVRRLQEVLNPEAAAAEAAAAKAAADAAAAEAKRQGQDPPSPPRPRVAGGKAVVEPSQRKKKTPLRQQNPVLSSEDLLGKIRHEVHICGCTELPGVVHPDVIRRLYRVQTERWQGEAEAHMTSVATSIRQVSESLLASVCRPSGGTSFLHAEFQRAIAKLYDSALERALSALRTYCEGDRNNPPQTTDPEFTRKLRLLQSLRIGHGLSNAIKLVQTYQKQVSAEELGMLVFDSYHHSTLHNTVYEVHDILKVYYQFSLQAFIRHVTHTIVENFVRDPTGPLHGFSAKFIYELPAEEVDRLGGESRLVIDERKLLASRIETLRAAQITARQAVEKTESPKYV